jgi:type I restriction enzyme R subunit
MRTFNEDTRVKIPATIQFLRLGYEYQSLSDIDIDKETRIERIRLKKGLEAINGRSFSLEEITAVIDEIHTAIKNNDLGRTFYEWLINPQGKVQLIDFDNIDNNDFAVVDELFYGPEELGSFRPDINVLINGIPLAFLEVKKPNNPGGIQQEFRRMLNDRLNVPEYKKYFNMLQIVSFSNNMEYEDDNDAVSAEDVKAGSFYTTPNGQKTSFSFFREEEKLSSGTEVSSDFIKYVLKDNKYSPTVFDTPEFQTNLSPDTPCNKFVTSLFTKERLMFMLRYGMLYLDKKVKEKHIMRYPQFFASRKTVERLDKGMTRGIWFETQGSGKTELSFYCIRILRDYYAKKGIVARFYYVVDRLSLLTQVTNESAAHYISTSNVSTRTAFESELQKPLQTNYDMKSWGELTVVNIQKFIDHMPVSKNPYKAKIQRVFFVDEAHRSYSMTGEFFKNLLLVDREAVFLAMTGTPLLSKKERSNLKFGDYIHTYFYDRSIADHYTLRIKREEINTTARAEIKQNLNIPDADLNKKEVLESPDYINALGKFIDKDFNEFRVINQDASIGGMIVCCSNTQAKRMKEWFNEHSNLETGLVITDQDIPEKQNKETQISFRETLKPDMLIVHQMLTTGYDVARLKKMYLLRNAKEHTLLQTISRVNRPYKNEVGKTYQYGYITDFVDISAEYDRTIENYLKEIEEDFNDGGDEYNLTGLILGPDDINLKYEAYKNKLDAIVETDNIEKFSGKLTYFNQDAVLEIKRCLNGIKNCHTEFMISHADDLAGQIDIDRIKKLLRETQNRLDFLNLRSQPASKLNVLTNKELVEIIYEFFRIRTEVLDFDNFTQKYKDFKDTHRFQDIQKILENIQKEVKRNHNHTQTQFIELDEMLKNLFADMEISMWEDIEKVNGGLADVLKRMKALNDENDALSERFEGNYSFVKTYTDAVETHPDLPKEDIGKLMDIIYAAVKDIQGSNILILQGRENFTSSVKKNTTARLFKEGLYSSLVLKDWFDTLLNETYANMKVF